MAQEQPVTVPKELAALRDNLGQVIYGKAESIASLRASLAGMDRQLAKLGLVRAPGETLLQFSARIVRDGPDSLSRDRTSAWYRLYASARYDPACDREALASKLKSDLY